jgi:hypothetical protein
VVAGLEEVAQVGAELSVLEDAGAGKVSVPSRLIPLCAQ